jgi:hypothetical protein
MEKAAALILVHMAAAHFVTGPGASAGGDLVFVHGLDGDPFKTWNLTGDESWSTWLAVDRPDLNVWTLEYDVRSTAWAGRALPLTDRATNVLATLDGSGLGSRPLCFVTHSFGGLLVKQLLRHAIDFANEYESIVRHTRGVVFLSTPHAGSDLASLASYLKLFIRPTHALVDVEAHAPALRELNLWFRNSATGLGIATKAFWETEATGGVTVVDATSADPGIPGVTPIPIETNHVGICKPRTRADLQYTQTLKFITDRIPRQLSRFGSAYFSIQEELLQQHTRRFVGRGTVQEAFVSFLRSSDRGYFIIEGGPGQGKTALASYVAKIRGCPHHFFSRSGGRDDIRLVLGSLLAQLPTAAEITFGPSDTVAELAKKFDDAVRRSVAASTAPLVIVLDGLDELVNPYVDGIPPCLVTEALPQGLYFFLTSRPDPLVDLIRDRRDLVPVVTHVLEPLILDDVRAIVGKHHVVLTTSELQTLLDVSAGNALYVEAATRALADGAAFDPLRLPPQIEGYFRYAVKGVATSSVARDTLGFLATTRTWLTTRQLATLTGVSERIVAAEGLAPLRHFLRSSAGTYGFYHQSFHRFVTTEVFFNDEVRRYHERVAQWLSQPDSDEDYRCSSLAYHLAEAGDHDGLVRKVDASFLRAKARRYGYSVLEDLEFVATSLLHTGDVSVIERCVNLVDSLRPLLGNSLDGEMNRGPARIQKTCSIAHVEAHAILVARGAVTADFVEMVALPDRLVVAIGDAPATGVKSAFVARFVATVFRRLVQTANERDLGKVLAELSRAIAAHPYFERISVQCIDVCPKERLVGIANAGHPFPLMYAASLQQIDRLPVRGPLLRDAPAFDAPLPVYKERHAEIGPGDVIVLVSDGLTEAGRLDGEPYGYRFANVLQRSLGHTPAALAESILADWRVHPRPPEISDDVTVVVVRIAGTMVPV